MFSQGGAADFAMRRLRALFVGEILESFNFEVEIREDSVFARAEGFDEETMKQALQILGYVIIHTRQLDMVMSNSSSVKKYRTKILDDINGKLVTNTNKM